MGLDSDHAAVLDFVPSPTHDHVVRSPPVHQQHGVGPQGYRTNYQTAGELAPGSTCGNLLFLMND